MKAEVQPCGGSKVCKTGISSSLKLQVLQMPVSMPLGDQELMYEVDGLNNWNVHGKSMGRQTSSTVVPSFHVVDNKQLNRMYLLFFFMFLPMLLFN